MKKIKVAINGFGRIGRSFFKVASKRPEFDFIAINDLGDVENLAYLLRYDTVYGRCEQKIETKKNTLIVDGKEIKFFQEKDPEKLPWKELDIDIVCESTGFFASREGGEKHLRAGAKRVVITAPAKGGVPTILVGINDEDLKKDKITSNASCTTNCVGPVAYVMNENPGIKKALLSTVHAYTATQNLVDGPNREGRDVRRGRAASQNIVPSTTGAAEATAQALPELSGIFTGVALRVPVVCGSIIDFTFLAKRKTSVEEINEIFRKAASQQRWKGILEVSDEPLVSSDILKTNCASIVDLAFTRVVDGDLVKVLSWYDNEWGYSWMLAEQIARVGKLI